MRKERDKDFEERLRRRHEEKRALYERLADRSAGPGAAQGEHDGQAVDVGLL